MIFQPSVSGGKGDSGTVTIQFNQTSNPSWFSGDISYVNANGEIVTQDVPSGFDVTVSAKKGSVFGCVVLGGGMVTGTYIVNGDGEIISSYYRKGGYGDIIDVYSFIVNKDEVFHFAVG